jgi:hypothetical protein
MTLRQRRPQTTTETEVFPSSASSDASSWWWPAASPASNALTADENEIWNAGRFAPASIRFTFDAPFTCKRIELLPCMVPRKGPVVHAFRTASFATQIRLDAADRQWIAVDFSGDGLHFRTIEIATLESPSWVAWRCVRFWKN